MLILVFLKIKKNLSQAISGTNKGAGLEVRKQIVLRIRNDRLKEFIADTFL